MVILAKRAYRRDALPERIDYRDVGCSLHSHCLTCPLPVCKEELALGIKSVRAHMRRLQIALFASEGHSVDWIAQVMGISKRSVYRSLASRNSDTALLTDTNGCATMNVAAIADNGR